MKKKSSKTQQSRWRAFVAAVRKVDAAAAKALTVLRKSPRVSMNMSALDPASYASSAPMSLPHILMSLFSWESTPQGQSYWSSLYRRLLGIPLGERCTCDSCGAHYSIDSVSTADIPRFHDRIEAGGIVPAGQCEKCGALVYLDQNPYMKDAAALLRATVAEIEAAGDDCPSPLREISPQLSKLADIWYKES